MSLADMFPPGFDLCTFPAGTPPEGYSPNFENPQHTMRALTLGLTITLTVVSTLVAFTRLFVNRSKFSIGDAFVVLAVVFNIAEATTMIVFVKYFRHMWDTPLCWINGRYLALNFTWEVVDNFGLMCSKFATLLLFHQLFTVSKRIRWAIRIGLALSFVLYMLTVAVLAYFVAPHAGQKWDHLVWEDLVLKGVKNPNTFAYYWGTGQGAASTLLDIYIFILPIPILAKLQLSRKRRFQIMAAFFTAVLAVVASIASLAFRVQAIHGDDKSWYAGSLMNCNLAEMTIATIIASAPGFASFIRIYLSDTKLLKSMFSTWRGTTEYQSSDPKTFNPNVPRSRKNNNRHFGNDSWLLKSNATTEISGFPSGSSNSQYNKSGVMKKIDIEQVSFQESTTTAGKGSSMV